MRTPGMFGRPLQLWIWPVLRQMPVCCLGIEPILDGVPCQFYLSLPASRQRADTSATRICQVDQINTVSISVTGAPPASGFISRKKKSPCPRLA